MDSDTLTKYNIAAGICRKVFLDIRESIMAGNVNVKDICEFGTNRICEECNKVFKKETNKGVAFPVCVSLNDCVGSYVYEKDNDKYNKLKSGDTLKIEMGVNIGGCIASFGDTFIYNSSEQDRYKMVLDEITGIITNNIKAGFTTHELRRLVEARCTEFDCFPMENCVSYQRQRANEFELPKYIVLNHQKYYDDDDNLIVEPNYCFEFEEGEVYDINLTMLWSTEKEHVYKERHLPHVARFNEYYHGLKLKSSREFCSDVKTKYSNGAFELSKYTDNVKYRMGIRECESAGILDTFPVLYEKHGNNVFFRKFTVVVGKGKCVLLKYK
jgi:methionine aminopeptidase